MKFNKYQFLILPALLLICFLTSCRQTDREDLPYLQNATDRFRVHGKQTEVINVPGPEEKISPLSAVIDSVSLIPLESSKECIIGRVSKLYVTPHAFYIFDQKKSKDLFCFNRDGTFNFRINRFGRGPGEYRSMQDVFVDSHRDRILILDSQQSKILIYSMQGKWVRDIRIKSPVPFTNIASYDSTYLLSFNNLGFNQFPGLMYNLLEIDQKGQITSRAMPFLKNQYFRVSNPFLFNLDHQGNTLFVSSFNSTVYRMNGNNIQAVYRLDFGENSIPDDLFDEFALETVRDMKKRRDLEEKSIEKVNKGKFSTGPGIVVDSENCFYFRYSRGPRQIGVFYFKDSKTVFPLNFISYENTYYGPLTVMALPVSSHGNELVGYIDPYQMIQRDKQYRQAGNYDKIVADHPGYTEILENANTYQNPILSIVKIKEL